MNIKRFLIGLFAAAAVITGCEPKEIDYGVARIEVSTSNLSFGASSSSQTLQLTATREWTVSGVPDWIAVDPSSGQPSLDAQTVTVTVIANEGYNREADITFTIGLMKEYVKVVQSGSKGEIDYGKGTLESPYSVDGVIAYINSLDNPAAGSPEMVYIKGKVSAIAAENDGSPANYSSSFGNGTFWISDDGSTTATQFYVFRANYLGNKKAKSGDTPIKVGDDVIIHGIVMLYGSNDPTPETSQGNAYLYSLNGVTGGSSHNGEPKGTGSLEDPFNVAAAINAVSGLDWASTDNYEKIGPFYVKGKISEIAKDSKTGEELTFTQSGNYSNATFYIVDEGFDGQFYCYRVAYLGGKKFVAGQTDIKVGDEVVVYGELMNYKGNTPETVQGSAKLYSLNGETGGGDEPPTPPAGDPKGTGTLDDPYNPAAAINAVKDLTWTSNEVYDTTDDVYVKGKISRIANNGTFTDGGTYGNASFYISEDGTSAGEFYCFRILYLGNKKFVEGQTDIKVGDEVVIYGKLMNYKGNTPETVANSAYLYSLNGETDGGGDEPPTPPTPPAGDPKGTGTLDDPYNPAAAINAVKDLTWTSNEVYDTTDDVYVKGKISRIANNGTFTAGGTYGNASFYISEDGTSANEFYCFRILYLGNEKFVEGQTDIKVGDEVVIYGKLMNYKGNTPETVSGKAYLYSLNGKTEDGGGDEPPTPPTPPAGDPNGTGTLDDPYNPAAALDAVKDLTWTSNEVYDTTDDVYVKGKISRIANNGTFTGGGTYGNASFYISEDGTSANEFYCFRVLYLGNKKFEEGQTDIKVGDEVVIYGKLMNYKGNTPETVSGKAYLYSLNGKTESEPGGDEPGGETSGDFSSALEWTLVANAYSDKATVNGTADVPVLKLGTSSKVGEATVTIPAGTKKLTFYGVSWKGKKTSVAIKIGDKTAYTQELAPNDGASNFSPYTMTVTESDHYTFALAEAPSAALTATLTTEGSNTRVILFGIKAE